MADEKSPGLLADVGFVRTVLARELDTINTYEEMAAKAENEDVRIFLKHLADDEKEHVAEATALLRRLDEVQEQHFQRDHSIEHMRGGAGVPGGGGPVAPAKPSPMAGASSAGSFTIGSLKRRDGN